MTRYEPGAVLLLAFPFTSGAGQKQRPALVVFDSGDDDVVVARITTQPRSSEQGDQIVDGRSETRGGGTPGSFAASAGGIRLFRRNSMRARIMAERILLTRISHHYAVVAGKPLVAQALQPGSPACRVGTRADTLFFCSSAGGRDE